MGESSRSVRGMKSLEGPAEEKAPGGKTPKGKPRRWWRKKRPAKEEEAAESEKALASVQEAPGTSGLLSLPDELLMEVLWDLPLGDVGRLQRTCVRLKKVASDARLWSFSRLSLHFPFTGGHSYQLRFTLQRGRRCLETSVGLPELRWRDKPERWPRRDPALSFLLLVLRRPGLPRIGSLELHVAGPGMAVRLWREREPFVAQILAEASDVRPTTLRLTGAFGDRRKGTFFQDTAKLFGPSLRCLLLQGKRKDSFAWMRKRLKGLRVFGALGDHDWLSAADARWLEHFGPRLHGLLLPAAPGVQSSVGDASAGALRPFDSDAPGTAAFATETFDPRAFFARPDLFCPCPHCPKPLPAPAPQPH